MVSFEEYLDNLKRVIKDLDSKESMLEENIEIHENIDQQLENEIRLFENGSDLVETRIKNLEAAERCTGTLSSIDSFISGYEKKIKNYKEQSLEDIEWEDDLRSMISKYNEINSEINDYRNMTTELSEKVSVERKNSKAQQRRYRSRNL